MTQHTELDYSKLEQKIEALEAILASHYRNSKLQAQVDNKSKGEGLPDYDSMASCIADQVDSGNDESTARQLCTELQKEGKLFNQGCKESMLANGVTMFDCNQTKSASVQEPPAWAVTMGLVEVNGRQEYEREQEEKQSRLKSASKRKYHWLDPYWHEDNGPSNHISVVR
jgi:hypothetical protein